MKSDDREGLAIFVFAWVIAMFMAGALALWLSDNYPNHTVPAVQTSNK
jgi:hypothetical protein